MLLKSHCQQQYLMKFSYLRQTLSAACHLFNRSHYRSSRVNSLPSSVQKSESESKTNREWCDCVSGIVLADKHERTLVRHDLKKKLFVRSSDLGKKCLKIKKCRAICLDDFRTNERTNGRKTFLNRDERTYERPKSKLIWNTVHCAKKFPWKI